MSDYKTWRHRAIVSVDSAETLSNEVITALTEETITVTATVTGPTSRDFNQAATYSVAIGGNGSGLTTYQWQRRTGSTGSWSDVASTAEYDYTGSASTSYQIRCIVTRQSVSATSNIITTAWAAPTLTAVVTGPSSRTLQQSAAYTVTVSGTQIGVITYQWQTRIGTGSWTDQVTTAGFTFTGDLSTTYDVRCVVDRGALSVNSNSITTAWGGVPTLAGLSTTLTTIRAVNTRARLYATFQYADNNLFTNPIEIFDTSLGISHSVAWEQPYGTLYVRGRLTTESEDGGVQGAWSSTRTIVRNVPRMLNVGTTDGEAAGILSAADTTDDFYATFQYSMNRSFPADGTVSLYDISENTTHSVDWSGEYGTNYFRGRLTTGVNDTGVKGAWSALFIETINVPSMGALTITEKRIKAPDTYDLPDLHATFEVSENIDFSGTSTYYYDTDTGATHFVDWLQPIGTRYIRGRYTTGINDTGLTSNWSETVTVMLEGLSSITLPAEPALFTANLRGYFNLSLKTASGSPTIESAVDRPTRNIARITLQAGGPNTTIFVGKKELEQSLLAGIPSQAVNLKGSENVFIFELPIAINSPELTFSFIGDLVSAADDVEIPRRFFADNTTGVIDSFSVNNDQLRIWFDDDPGRFKDRFETRGRIIFNRPDGTIIAELKNFQAYKSSANNGDYLITSNDPFVTGSLAGLRTAIENLNLGDLITIFFVDPPNIRLTSDFETAGMPSTNINVRNYAGVVRSKDATAGNSQLVEALPRGSVNTERIRIQTSPLTGMPSPSSAGTPTARRLRPRQTLQVVTIVERRMLTSTTPSVLIASTDEDDDISLPGEMFASGQRNEIDYIDARSFSRTRFFFDGQPGRFSPLFEGRGTVEIEHPANENQTLLATFDTDLQHSFSSSTDPQYYDWTILNASFGGPADVRVVLEGQDVGTEIILRFIYPAVAIIADRYTNAGRPTTRINVQKQTDLRPHATAPEPDLDFGQVYAGQPRSKNQVSGTPDIEPNVQKHTDLRFSRLVEFGRDKPFPSLRNVQKQTDLRQNVSTESPRGSIRRLRYIFDTALSNIQDLWSDGTTMWVTDAAADKIYAYNLASGSRVVSEDFNTLNAAGNNTPTGLWSDGTTMWVADLTDDKIYAYNLSTKARDPAKDFNTLSAAGNNIPYGIWSDGTTMWVVDASFFGEKIYAYNLATKARDASKDFNTLRAEGNTIPRGIWSDGTTMWVNDHLDEKIYAYNLSTKARDPDKDFDTQLELTGLWSNGSILWVGTNSLKIDAYNFIPWTPTAVIDVKKETNIRQSNQSLAVTIQSNIPKYTDLRQYVSAKISADFLNVELQTDLRSFIKGDAQLVISATLTKQYELRQRAYSNNPFNFLSVRQPIELKLFAKGNDVQFSRNLQKYTDLRFSAATGTPFIERSRPIATRSGLDISGGIPFVSADLMKHIDIRQDIRILVPAATSKLLAAQPAIAISSGTPSTTSRVQNHTNLKLSVASPPNDHPLAAVLIGPLRVSAASSNPSLNAASLERSANAKAIVRAVFELKNNDPANTWFDIGNAAEADDVQLPASFFAAGAVGDVDYLRVRTTQTRIYFDDSPGRLTSTFEAEGEIQILHEGTVLAVLQGIGVRWNEANQQYRLNSDAYFKTGTRRSFRTALEGLNVGDPITVYFIDYGITDLRAAGASDSPTITSNVQKITDLRSTTATANAPSVSARHIQVAPKLSTRSDTPSVTADLQTITMKSGKPTVSANIEIQSASVHYIPISAITDDWVDIGTINDGEDSITIPAAFFADDMPRTIDVIRASDDTLLIEIDERFPDDFEGIGSIQISVGGVVLAEVGDLGSYWNSYEFTSDDAFSTGGVSALRMNLETLRVGTEIEVSFFYATQRDVNLAASRSAGVPSVGVALQIPTLALRLLVPSLASRISRNDFDTLEDAGNTVPTGIWSDGTTMWVADTRERKIYAYNLSTKARDSGKDFDTLRAAANDNPRGIWSDGTTMWVADPGEQKLYAYNLSTKARDASKDFDTLRAAGNTAPRGIWSDGTTMWVVDQQEDKIYAYNLSTKARDSGKDFDTLSVAGNELPYGIWSDGTTMWVVDNSNREDKIYAYNLSTKARDSGKDFDTLHAAGNTNPSGIWSDGTTTWVADDNDGKIYAYNADIDSVPSIASNIQRRIKLLQHIQPLYSARDSGRDFDTLLAAGNTNPRGIWSDGTTIWVADTRERKIYAYNLSTKARDSGKDFDTLSVAGNELPYGIWSDGTTMWVADDDDVKIYAYNLSTKARDPGKDFDTLIAANNNRPQGLWSDGTTMWVADFADSKIYAYNLSSKARDASKDFSQDTLLAAGNTNTQGIWSDGTTMWVVDNREDKIYAYNLSTKARDAAKDFNTLSAASNEDPRGIWSDGTTMWVVDNREDKIYAYHLAPTPSLASNLQFDIRLAANSDDPTVSAIPAPSIAEKNIGHSISAGAPSLNKAVPQFHHVAHTITNAEPIIRRVFITKYTDLRASATSANPSFAAVPIHGELSASGSAGASSIRATPGKHFLLRQFAQSFTPSFTSVLLPTKGSITFTASAGTPTTDITARVSNRLFIAEMPLDQNGENAIWSRIGALRVDLDDITLPGSFFASGDPGEIDTIGVSAGQLRIWLDDSPGRFTPQFEVAGEIRIIINGTILAAVQNIEPYWRASGQQYRINNDIALTTSDISTLRNTLETYDEGTTVTLWFILPPTSNIKHTEHNAGQPVARGRVAAGDIEALRVVGTPSYIVSLDKHTDLRQFEVTGTPTVDGDVEKQTAVKLSITGAIPTIKMAAPTIGGISQSIVAEIPTVLARPDRHTDLRQSIIADAPSWATELAGRKNLSLKKVSGIPAYTIAALKRSLRNAISADLILSRPMTDTNQLDAVGTIAIPSQTTELDRFVITENFVIIYTDANGNRFTEAFERDAEFLFIHNDAVLAHIGRIDGNWAGDEFDRYEVNDLDSIIATSYSLLDEALDALDVGTVIKVAIIPRAPVTIDSAQIRAGNASVTSKLPGFTLETSRSAATPIIREDNVEDQKSLRVRGRAGVPSAIANVEKHTDLRVSGNADAPSDAFDVQRFRNLSLNVDTKVFATSTIRDPVNDFNTLVDAGNAHPTGIWSDGITMWVSDSYDNKIYAYNLETRLRDPAKDFNTLDDDNTFATSITSDGTTMWVADPGFPDMSADRLFAYNLQTKARDAAKDFTTLYDDGVRVPRGIWTDGTTMWVSDAENIQNPRIWAYNLQTKARDSGKDLPSQSRGPNGMWSDGTTLWLVSARQLYDPDTREIELVHGLYAYDLATNSRDESKDFIIDRSEGHTDLDGVWSDGTTVWVTNNDTAIAPSKIFAYKLTLVPSLNSNIEAQTDLRQNITAAAPSNTRSKPAPTMAATELNSGTPSFSADIQKQTDLRQGIVGSAPSINSSSIIGPSIEQSVTAGTPTLQANTQKATDIRQSENAGTPSHSARHIHGVHGVDIDGGIPSYNANITKYTDLKQDITGIAPSVIRSKPLPTTSGIELDAGTPSHQINLLSHTDIRQSENSGLAPTFAGNVQKQTDLRGSAQSTTPNTNIIVFRPDVLSLHIASPTPSFTTELFAPVRTLAASRSAGAAADQRAWLRYSTNTVRDTLTFRTFYASINDLNRANSLFNDSSAAGALFTQDNIRLSFYVYDSGAAEHLRNRVNVEVDNRIFPGEASSLDILNFVVQGWIETGNTPDADSTTTNIWWTLNPGDADNFLAAVRATGVNELSTTTRVSNIRLTALRCSASAGTPLAHLADVKPNRDFTVTRELTTTGAGTTWINIAARGEGDDILLPRNYFANDMDGEIDLIAVRSSQLRFWLDNSPGRFIADFENRGVIQFIQNDVVLAEVTDFGSYWNDGRQQYRLNNNDAFNVGSRASLRQTLETQAIGTPVSIRFAFTEINIGHSVSTGTPSVTSAVEKDIEVGHIAVAGTPTVTDGLLGFTNLIARAENTATPTITSNLQRFTDLGHSIVVATPSITKSEIFKRADLSASRGNAGTPTATFNIPKYTDLRHAENAGIPSRTENVQGFTDLNQVANADAPSTIESRLISPLLKAAANSDAATFNRSELRKFTDLKQDAAADTPSVQGAITGYTDLTLHVLEEVDEGLTHTETFTFAISAPGFHQSNPITLPEEFFDESMSYMADNTTIFSFTSLFQLQTNSADIALKSEVLDELTVTIYDAADTSTPVAVMVDFTEGSTSASHRIYNALSDDNFEVGTRASLEAAFRAGTSFVIELVAGAAEEVQNVTANLQKQTDLSLDISAGTAAVIESKPAASMDMIEFNSGRPSYSVDLVRYTDLRQSISADEPLQFSIILRQELGQRTVAGSPSIQSNITKYTDLRQSASSTDATITTRLLSGDVEETRNAGIPSFVDGLTKQTDLRHAETAGTPHINVELEGIALKQLSNAGTPSISSTLLKATDIRQSENAGTPSASARHIHGVHSVDLDAGIPSINANIQYQFDIRQKIVAETPQFAANTLKPSLSHGLIVDTPSVTASLTKYTDLRISIRGGVPKATSILERSSIEIDLNAGTPSIVADVRRRVELRQRISGAAPSFRKAEIIATDLQHYASSDEPNIRRNIESQRDIAAMRGSAAAPTVSAKPASGYLAHRITAAAPVIDSADASESLRAPIQIAYMRYHVLGLHPQRDNYIGHPNVGEADDPDNIFFDGSEPGSAELDYIFVSDYNIIVAQEPFGGRFDSDFELTGEIILTQNNRTLAILNNFHERWKPAGGGQGRYDFNDDDDILFGTRTSLNADLSDLTVGALITLYIIPGAPVALQVNSSAGDPRVTADVARFTDLRPQLSTETPTISSELQYEINVAAASGTSVFSANIQKYTDLSKTDSSADPAFHATKLVFDLKGGNYAAGTTNIHSNVQKLTDLRQFIATDAPSISRNVASQKDISSRAVSAGTASVNSNVEKATAIKLKLVGDEPLIIKSQPDIGLIKQTISTGTPSISITVQSFAVVGLTTSCGIPSVTDEVEKSRRVIRIDIPLGTNDDSLNWIDIGMRGEGDDLLLPRDFFLSGMEGEIDYLRSRSTQLRIILDGSPGRFSEKFENEGEIWIVARGETLVALGNIGDFWNVNNQQYRINDNAPFTVGSTQSLRTDLVTLPISTGTIITVLFIYPESLIALSASRSAGNPSLEDTLVNGKISVNVKSQNPSLTSDLKPGDINVHVESDVPSAAGNVESQRDLGVRGDSGIPKLKLRLRSGAVKHTETGAAPNLSVTAQITINASISAGAPSDTGNVDGPVIRTHIIGAAPSLSKSVLSRFTDIRPAIRAPLPRITANADNLRDIRQMLSVGDAHITSKVLFRPQLHSVVIAGLPTTVRTKLRQGDIEVRVSSIAPTISSNLEIQTDLRQSEAADTPRRIIEVEESTRLIIHVGANPAGTSINISKFTDLRVGVAVGEPIPLVDVFDKFLGIHAGTQEPQIPKRIVLNPIRPMRQAAGEPHLERSHIFYRSVLRQSIESGTPSVIKAIPLDRSRIVHRRSAGLPRIRVAALSQGNVAHNTTTNDPSFQVQLVYGPAATANSGIPSINKAALDTSRAVQATANSDEPTIRVELLGGTLGVQTGSLRPNARTERILRVGIDAPHLERGHIFYHPTLRQNLIAGEPTVTKVILANKTAVKIVAGQPKLIKTRLNIGEIQPEAAALDAKLKSQLYYGISATRSSGMPSIMDMNALEESSAIRPYIVAGEPTARVGLLSGKLTVTLKTLRPSLRVGRILRVGIDTPHLERDALFFRPGMKLKLGVGSPLVNKAKLTDRSTTAGIPFVGADLQKQTDIRQSITGELPTTTIGIDASQSALNLIISALEPLIMSDVFTEYLNTAVGADTPIPLVDVFDKFLGIYASTQEPQIKGVILDPIKPAKQIGGPPHLERIELFYRPVLRLTTSAAAPRLTVPLPLRRSAYSPVVKSNIIGPTMSDMKTAGQPADRTQIQYLIKQQISTDQPTVTIGLDPSNAINVSISAGIPTITEYLSLTMAANSNADIPTIIRRDIEGPTIREQIETDAPTATSRIPVTLSASSSSTAPSVMSNVERHTELRPEIIAGTPLVVKAVSREAHFDGTPNLDLDVVDATGENLIKTGSPSTKATMKVPKREQFDINILPPAEIDAENVISTTVADPVATSADADPVIIRTDVDTRE